MKISGKTLAVLFMLSMCSTGAAGIVLGNPTLVTNSALGFGNAPPVLTLVAPSTETGAVSWTAGGEVKSGDFVANQTSIISASEISQNVGTTNLGISFNMNEAGMVKEASLDDLTVNLYLADGTLFQTVSVSPGNLPEPGGGQGGDGYFFPLTQMTNELTTFFSDGNNRLGISASISNVEAGAESFRVATAVPEPSAFLCVGLIAGFVLLSSRRRNY